MADEPAGPEDEDATPDEVEATTEVEGAEEAGEPMAAPAPPRSHVRLALIVGTVVVVALGGLVGWLGYRAYEARKAEQLHDLLVGVGRQGAINLTTIDAAEADKDVQRILDSATEDRKSTRLNSSHIQKSRMPSSA